MNKKNITLICAGIMLLTLQFNIHIGTAVIDIFSDVIAFALILAGSLGLARRNVMFKRSRNMSVLGLIFASVGQFLHLFDWGSSASQINVAVLGLSTIFAIYFTYYFNEAIMLESKFQDKAALTRSFRTLWMLLGILLFVNYIAFMSNLSMVSLLTQAITIIFSIYYCSSVLSSCRQLYMDGLPTKHMDL